MTQRRPKYYAAWMSDLRGLRDDPNAPAVQAAGMTEVQRMAQKIVEDGVAGGIHRGSRAVVQEYGGLILFGFVFVGTCVAITAVASIITAASVSGREGR